MIYFDNAATTFKKPNRVYEAVLDTLKNKAGNPSRGGHKAALDASRVIFDARRRLAKFFNVPSSKEIIFTKNATEANNLILKGLIEEEDHVITTDLEHNSIYRPLNRLKKERGIDVSTIDTSQSIDNFLKDIETAINDQTKLIVMTHASNVTGAILATEEVGQIAKENNIIFAVDAAQTAGVLDIDVQTMNIDFLSFTGHKGLLAPQGVGGLYINSEIEFAPLLEGGTGGSSKEKLNPNILPDKYESGTLNTPAIAGLKAGIEFLEKEGLDRIYNHELELLNRLTSGLLEMKEVKILDTKAKKNKVAVISFIVSGIKSATIGNLLDKNYDIAVRTGLHCAPLAHQSIGTYDVGTVRVSFSYFNTIEEVDIFLKALKDIINTRCK
ncbi:aminotransferase class V-fold PLP-dependent enzyme [Orenia marismortui]|uniref:cysteine desulfurase n=1 Tax=Orenia marismortui TaxID=46469 RepID=A0A4R8HAB3_9FIRM|nr:aminotransferase class V-fold PLP-dependent enzyme [Orenia marismortui]TDX53233.1 cysteine desulfurase family protein [Orenia marismortui]